MVNVHAWVFWLPFHPTLRAFPKSGAPVAVADFVHGYSCGAAPAFHRLPQSMHFWNYKLIINFIVS